MLGLGLNNPVHIAFVVLILLLLFGAKRLPELGSSLGAGLRGFKESVSGEADRSRDASGTPAAAPPARLTAAPAVPAEPPAEAVVAGSESRPAA